MDGQDSLWRAGWEHLPEALGEVTEILDLLHAVAYLWEAVSLFHPEAARAFVKEQAQQQDYGTLEMRLKIA